MPTPNNHNAHIQIWEIASQPNNRKPAPTTMRLLQQRPVRINNSKRGSLFKQYK